MVLFHDLISVTLSLPYPLASLQGPVSTTHELPYPLAPLEFRVETYLFDTATTLRTNKRGLVQDLLSGTPWLPYPLVLPTFHQHDYTLRSDADAAIVT